MAGRSRMNREIHVRICGGLEVRFLRSTRQAAFGQEWKFSDQKIVGILLPLYTQSGHIPPRRLSCEATYNSTFRYDSFSHEQYVSCLERLSM